MATFVGEYATISCCGCHARPVPIVSSKMYLQLTALSGLAASIRPDPDFQNVKPVLANRKKSISTALSLSDRSLHPVGVGKMNIILHCTDVPSFSSSSN